MKKILFSLFALFMCAQSINAQVIQVYKNGVLQNTYENTTTEVYNVKFMAPFEHVDLGLSVVWANCNVGANSPEEYGDYFAWGETTPSYTGDSQAVSPTWKTGKGGYDWSNYSLCNGSITTMTKYCSDSSYGIVDDKTVLERGLEGQSSNDDAASVNMGGAWRMPTSDEINELLNNTYNGWIVNYKSTGINGYIFYKKVSGKSSFSEYTTDDIHIFLPATGWRYQTSLNRVGQRGCYWSSSFSATSTYSACCINFNKNAVGNGSDGRCRGFSVRAVRTKD